VSNDLGAQQPARRAGDVCPAARQHLSFVINSNCWRAVKDLDQRPQDGDRLILLFVGAGGWDTYACARRTPQAILTSCPEELILSTLSRETEQSRDDLAPPAAVRQVFAQDG